MPIALALAVACRVGAAINIILTFKAWHNNVGYLRIYFIGWIGLLSLGCVPVVVLAFATPRIGKLSASASVVSIIV